MPERDCPKPAGAEDRAAAVLPGRKAGGTGFDEFSLLRLERIDAERDLRTIDIDDRDKLIADLQDIADGKFKRQFLHGVPP
jgi:hypothetical protein